MSSEKMGTMPMAWGMQPRPIPNRQRTLSEVVKRMISLQLAADFSAQTGTASDPIPATRETMLARVKGLLTSGALIGHAETDDGKFEIAPQEWDDDRFSAALQYRGTITVWVESGNGLREILGEGAINYDDFFDLTAVEDYDDRPGDEMAQLATAHSFEVPRRQVTVEPTFYDREIERAFNYGPSAYATTTPKAAPSEPAKRKTPNDGIEAFADRICDRLKQENGARLTLNAWAVIIAKEWPGVSGKTITAEQVKNRLRDKYKAFDKWQGTRSGTE